MSSTSHIMCSNGGALESLYQDSGGPTYTGHVVLFSTTFAFITVVDVADLNPRFLGLPYRGMVEEHTPVVSGVLTIL